MANDEKRWCEYGESGTLIHCWWEYKLAKAVYKLVWRFLKELEIDLLYNIDKALLVYLPKVLYILFCSYLLIHVHCYSIHNSQEVENGLSMGVHQLIIKIWHIYSME